MWTNAVTRNAKNTKNTIFSIAKKYGRTASEEIYLVLEEIIKSDPSKKELSEFSWSDITNSDVIKFEERLKNISASSSQTSSAIEGENEKTSSQEVQTESLGIRESRSSDNLEAEDYVSLHRQSEESIGSNALVNASRTRDILLAHNSSVEIVQQDTGTETCYKLRPNVEFYFNKGQRGKTYLPGNSQGNHISSYISILTAFVHTIANESGIDQAIERFRDVGLNLLEDEKDVVSEIQRRRIHSSLLPKGRNDALNYIPEDVKTTVEKQNGESVEIPLRIMVKKGLIYERIDEKAKLLDGLGNYVLRKIQENKDFTVYSKGRIDARKDEGAVAKDSIRGLIFLDKVCLLSSMTNDQEFEEELAPFLKSLEKFANKSAGRSSSSSSAAAVEERVDDEMEDDEGQDTHLMRYGMNAWFEDDGKSADNFITRLKSAESVQAKREILQQVIKDMMEKNREEKTISGFIGGLFDYDRELVFDCKKAFPISKKELDKIDSDLDCEVATGNLKPEKVDSKRIIRIEEKIKEKISDQFGGEFLVEKGNIEIDIACDTNKKISGRVSLTRNDKEKLLKITTKHLDIMDVICHNAMNHELTRDAYDMAKEEFATNSVLINGGWNKLEGFGQNTLSFEIKEQIKAGKQKQMGLSGK